MDTFPDLGSLSEAELKNLIRSRAHAGTREKLRGELRRLVADAAAL